MQCLPCNSGGLLRRNQLEIHIASTEHNLRKIGEEKDKLIEQDCFSPLAGLFTYFCAWFFFYFFLFSMESATYKIDSMWYWNCLMLRLITTKLLIDIHSKKFEGFFLTLQIIAITDLSLTSSHTTSVTHAFWFQPEFIISYCFANRSCPPYFFK